MATHKQVKRKGFEWYRMLTKKQRKEWRKETLKHSSTNVLEWYHFVLNRTCTFSSFISNTHCHLNDSKINYWIPLLKKTWYKMKTLEQIKNEHAKSKGYDDWSHLIKSGHFAYTLFAIDELLMLVQKECLKNASSNFLGQSRFAIDTREQITN